jgi:UDP-glucose-4-epimerase GalE
VEGNIADQSLITKTLQRFRIDAVAHLAAYAYVGQSLSNPGMYFDNNVMGSLRLLEAMRETNVKYIVFSSTCTTYGNPETLPIGATHPQRPLSPYGESKLLAEKLLHWYGEIYGINWVALRYFNAAGADPDGEIGEHHEPEKRLIPLVLEAALDPTHPVSVFGSDYPTPDGTALRDYIHVADLSDAHVLALQYLRDGGESCPLNLGTGKGQSVRQVIETVAAVTGQRPAVREMDRRPGDPPELAADASRACRLLGWRPGSSTPNHIIETAWNWRIKQCPHTRGRDAVHQLQGGGALDIAIRHSAA